MNCARHLLLVSFFHLQVSLAQETIAHAHNDYLNNRPLFGALENGFQSIEVDIFEYDGEIKVSHFGNHLSKKPSFKALYLDPLVKFLEANTGIGVWLLIDLKQEDQSLLDLLHGQIEENGKWFKSKRSGESGPVQILLSGSVQRNLVAQSKRYEYFYLDGRIHHLEQENWDSDLMPLISANIKKVVSWNGQSEMNKADRARIEELVKTAQNQGKKLRFWNTKDSKATWKMLQALGVDVIGTDDIRGLATFLGH